jgi:cell division protease FtsH
MQVLVLMLLFGSMGKSFYSKYNQKNSGAPGPPVEVPYSSFLELVEQSGTAGGSDSVLMDNVRIGPDKLIYRLTKEAAPGEAPKQMIAYTQKVAAPPELIHNLHKNGIPFTAASRQRTNTLAMAARSAILGFYMLILWRMYRTFSGNSSSGDIPGKLASKSSLPLASFNEIQGIDTAKTEVMELVDTLRNPEKYAILGARAPTGLLLEGNNDVFMFAFCKYSQFFSRNF